MRHTNAAAGRTAHAPGDDPLARALKELNSRALRAACPSGHKCRIPRVCRCRGVIVRKSFQVEYTSEAKALIWNIRGDCDLTLWWSG